MTGVQTCALPISFAGTKTPAALKFSSKGATTDYAETPVNCPHCGQKWRLRRRLRRQPFILLSFSASKKARKAQETQLYQRFQHTGHTDFNTSGTNDPRGETGASPPSATAQSCATSEITLYAVFVTPDSAALLYTYISRFSEDPHHQQQLYLRPSFIPIFNFSHKRPTFAFTGESGYALGSSQRIAHNGSHGETGAIRMGVVSLPSIRAARSRISPGRVSERQTLPLLGLGRRRTQRTQRAFGTAMRLCVSLFRGVAAPLGCVIFFCFCQNCGLHTMCSVLSACARRGVVSPLLVCSACCRNSRSPLVKTTNLSFSEVGWASLIPAAQNVLDR